MRKRWNTYKRMVRLCPVCRGDGEFLMAGRVVECRKCKGTGQLRNK